MGVNQLLLTVLGFTALTRHADALAFTTPDPATPTLSLAEDATTKKVTVAADATSTFAVTDPTSTWSVTGADISTTATLDYETLASWVVTVVASETGTTNSATLTLTIALTDADDRAPTTTCASNSLAVVLPEGYAAGSTVCAGFVSDDGTVTYAITGGNGDSNYKVNGAAIVVNDNKRITSTSGPTTLTVTGTSGTAITAQISISVGTLSTCYCASGVTILTGSILAMLVGILVALQ